jgi:hypothetical protein
MTYKYMFLRIHMATNVNYETRQDEHDPNPRTPRVPLQSQISSSLDEFRARVHSGARMVGFGVAEIEDERVLGRVAGHKVPVAYSSSVNSDQVAQ